MTGSQTTSACKAACQSTQYVSEIRQVCWQVALEGEASAELQAIARTAKHRLDRGIFTSPGAGRSLRPKHKLTMLSPALRAGTSGVASKPISIYCGLRTGHSAGDIRRAKAAAERLCILAGDDCPWQRRDAGVLLLHAGQICQAATELEAYHSSAFYRSGASSEERNLVERLLAMLHAHPGIEHPTGRKLGLHVHYVSAQ